MPQEASQLDWNRIKKFAESTMSDLGIAAQSALSYIGDKLGIFRALDGAGWVTSAELAGRTGLSERYIREWLGAMVAARYVEYDPAACKFFLQPEHAMVLARDDSPFFFGGFMQMIVPNAGMAPKVAEAFKTGKGVPQSEYPPETFEAVERLSASMYQDRLVRKWLPTMRQVVTALSEGGAALDVGCGSGRAAIALAKGFPKARVSGYDAHPESIERARNNARAAGVQGRVSFETVDCTRLPAERWDLITTFDVVHESVDPVALLSSIRDALKPDGTYVMLEMNMSANLEDNINPLGRLMYSISTLYCITVSLAGGGPGIGAVMGEPKARELCQQAGFTRFRRLPIEDAFSALYEIRR
ncbi:MAG: class I SAM-dependent methyltransferase [Candidatus Binataceae bacterium]